MILLFSVALVSLLRARRVSKTSCGSSAAFYRIAKDHALNEEPISRNITTDLEECIDLCIEEPKCKAMNTHYRDDGKMDCHLLKDDHMSKPKKMITKQGWNIYDTGSKAISRTVSSFFIFHLLHLQQYIYQPDSPLPPCEETYILFYYYIIIYYFSYVQQVS